MKLEPIFLLAPRKQMPTRRAFLIAGGASLGAFAAGFGAGWLIRGGAAHPAAPTLIDPRLAEALELADPATPIAKLLEQQMFLVSIVHEQQIAGHTHDALWRAIHRVAREVIDDRSLPDRRQRARALVDLLARTQPVGVDFDPLVSQLQEAMRR